MKLVMRPSYLGLNAAHMVLQNSIFGSNNSLQSGVISDCKNLGSGKFGVAASLPAIRSAVLYSVVNIAGMCIPSQIGNGIIGGYAVIVAALHAIWARAMKGPSNEPSGQKGFRSALFPKRDSALPIALANAGLELIPLYGISDIAKARRFVKPLISDNRLPFFNHKYSSDCLRDYT